MVGAQDPLAVGEGPLVQRDGLVQAPRRLIGAGEVVAGGQGIGVVGAQDPLGVGEGALVAAGSPRPAAPPPGRRRRGCCGRPGYRGGRGPGPARSRRGSARTARSPPRGAPPLVGASEVVAGGQGIGVVGAQDPLAVGEGPLIAARSPPPAAPPPDRRQRGCCGRPGCRGGRRPRPARGR